MTRLTDLMAEVAAEREKFASDVLYTYGAGIKQAREQKGMTQEHLASLVGLTRSSIANIEAGRQDTPLSQAVLLAEVLGVSLTVQMPGHGSERPGDES